MRRVRPGCVRFSFAAARPKCPSVATAAKARSCRSSICASYSVWPARGCGTSWIDNTANYCALLSPEESKVEVSGKLLNTEEAARFLRVSEASIRRWSDAGLLPAVRVGGRRERRVREAHPIQYLGARQHPPHPP